MVKVLFVCLGNICRSTMAEFVMKHKVKQKGLENKIYIESCGVSSVEQGSDTHYGTKNILDKFNIPYCKRSARKINKGDMENFDYIVYMDNSNLKSIHNMFGSSYDSKLKKLTNYIGLDRDVADPWYTGDFMATYEDVEAGCTALLKTIGENFE